MAYCRFSPISDIYCYLSFNGYVIHVASSRWAIDFEFDDTPESYKKLVESKTKTLVKIGGPFDGELITCEKAATAACILTELRKNGYNVPDIAIASLMEEATKGAG